MSFSINDYYEMVTMGCANTIEDFIASQFIDNDSIVHCIDNNTDYHQSDIQLLIDYVKERTFQK